jgi:pyocin large subunit-like protein
MPVKAIIGFIALLVGACGPSAQPAPAARAPSQYSVPAVNTATTQASSSVRTNVGFRSRKQLDDHFAKHGREFGGVSKQEYLLEAQQLRDAPVGGDVEEIVRSDGSSSRYDRKSGAFLAFNRDGTIRTFFKPNNGESYFRRQAERSH